MQVIPPVAITAAMFTSSTVLETAPAAYNGATAYAIGNQVSVAGTANSFTCYQSLQNANTGHTPASSPTWWQDLGVVYGAYSGAATYASGDYVQDNTNHIVYQSAVAGNIGNALTDTTKWTVIGPTNKWAMFDYLRNTTTSAPSTFTVVFAPGRRVNSFALAGITANSYSLTVTSVTGGGTVYSASGSFNTRPTIDWYGYFFGTFTYQEAVAFFDIPPYSDAIFALTISATSGNVSLGACVVGTYVYLGATQYSAVSDVLNFSTIARDSAGKATLTARRNVPKTRQQCLLAKTSVNQAVTVRDTLNATPAIWFGINTSTDGYFNSLLILGVYKTFSIDIGYTSHAVVSLELEEI